jgi:ribonuclease-3
VTDYKSALQEVVHSIGRPQPRYVLVKEEGPEHRKLFTMEAHIPASSNGDPEFVGRGEGGTKKLAEQWAARRAWEYLQSLQKASGENGGGPAGESV